MDHVLVDYVGIDQDGDWRVGHAERWGAARRRGGWAMSMIMSGRTSPLIHTAIHGDQSALADYGTGPSEAAAGAVVSFVGVVRDHDGGRSVRELEYVGHPDAARVLARVAGEVAARHPEVITVRAAHWLGLLRIGDCALYAEVSAAHRGGAFAACADLVETVKHTLPIWKRQIYVDGTEDWVNCP